MRVNDWIFLLKTPVAAISSIIFFCNFLDELSAANQAVYQRVLYTVHIIHIAQATNTCLMNDILDDTCESISIKLMSVITPWAYNDFNKLLGTNFDHNLIHNSSASIMLLNCRHRNTNTFDLNTLCQDAGERYNNCIYESISTWANRSDSNHFEDDEIRFNYFCF